MYITCFSKLQTIFVKILANKIPRDDTFVEKMVTLCSSFMTNSDQNKQFLQETGLTELINTCCNKDIGSESYAFFLRILGVVCQCSYTDVSVFPLTKLLSKINDAELQADASVRHAWVFMCHKLCNTENGLRYFINQPKLHHVLKIFCDDTSVFVANSARALVGYFLVRLKAYAQRIKNTTIDVGCEINETLNKTVDVFICDDLSSSLMTLHIVKAMCSTDCIVAADILEDKIPMFINEKFTNDHHRRSLWMEIFSAFLSNSRLNEEHQKQLMDLPHTFVLQKDHCSAAHLACWLLQRFSNSSDMLEILVHPLTQYVHSPLSSSSALTHNLLQSIRLTTHVPSSHPLLAIILKVLAKVTDDHSYSHHKIEAACLDSCYEMIGQATEAQALQLMRLNLDLLNNVEISYIITSKALRCIHKTLQHLLHLSPDLLTPASLSDLADVVSRKMCDRKWEVRDSAIEFTSQVIQDVAAHSTLAAEWLVSSGLLSNAVHSCHDGEGYTRATAIGCLMAAVAVSQLRKAIQLQGDSLVDRIIYIAKSDTEAIPRRAAVNLLSVFIKQNLYPSRSSDLLRVMVHVTQDLDWEVKLAALAFWQFEIEKCLETHPPDCMPITSLKRKHCDDVIDIGDELVHLWDVGCLQSLRDMAEDPDKSIQLKVCNILQYIQSKYCSAQKKAKSENGDVATNEQVGETDLVEDERKPSSVQSFIHWLQEVDTDLLEKRAKQSTDMYDDNPVSFLTDVLASLCDKKEVCDGTDADNAAAIDCY